MDIHKLKTTANALMAPTRGILAMDESTPTCGKRLQQAGVENTARNRIAYRHMLLGTPRLGDHISGAILYEETLGQDVPGGISFIDLLHQQDIIPGIKVDTGARDLAGHPGEKVTEGLDGLRERLRHYASAGARFCKWRAVITIGEGLPSRACIEANAHALARYAMLCQEADMVPIVEPEVLMTGDHTIERCYQVTLETQHSVFEQLYRQGVALSGMILKPSMVISGSDCEQQANVEQVAERTLDCLSNTVPAEVPGIAFLSGGQSDELATAHLDAINRHATQRAAPWRLTFSFARALQQPALAAWKGDRNNVDSARRLLLHRARLNSLASNGNYNQQMEQHAA